MSAFLRFLGRLDVALLRRYWVHKPDDEGYGIRKCFTLMGAKRVAKKTKGTRIYQPWQMSHIIVDRSWSERKNGYEPGAML